MLNEPENRIISCEFVFNSSSFLWPLEYSKACSKSIVIYYLMIITTELLHSMS